MAHLQMTDAASIVLPALLQLAEPPRAPGDRKRDHSDEDQLEAKRPRTAASGLAIAAPRLPSIGHLLPSVEPEIPPSTLEFLRHTTDLAPSVRRAMLQALICPVYFGPAVPPEIFHSNLVQIGIVVDRMADPIATSIDLFLNLADKFFMSIQRLAIAKRVWLPGTPQIPAAISTLLSNLGRASQNSHPSILAQLSRLIPHLSHEERLFALRLIDYSTNGFSSPELALHRRLCSLFVTEEMADILPTVIMGSRIVVVPERMSHTTALFLTVQLAGKLVRPTHEYATLSSDEEIAVETITAALSLLERV